MGSAAEAGAQDQAIRRTARIASDQIPPGGQMVLRDDGHQIAVFRLPSGALYAIDNACPHEGYPLAKGTVKDCVVTCIWHNFKFDLTDGSCLKGEEAVRTYPVREVDGQVEVEIVDPPASEQMPRFVASLEGGLLERRMGQVARDTVRLLKLGMGPEEISLIASRFDADYAEYGTSHAMAVSVDALRLLERYPGTEAVDPLMQAFDLCADTHVRRPKRPVPAPLDPGNDPAPAGERLYDLVEQEELWEAEALLRGALARGWDRSVVEPWLYRICAQHFMGFGHGLIYLRKIFDLLDAVGWDHAMDVLPAHLLALGSQTREDVLPEWGWFRKRMDAVEPSLEALYQGQAEADGDLDTPILVTALTDGAREEAFDAVTAALEGKVPLGAIVDAMSLAASERLLRFDHDIDADRTIQNSWLEVTHIFTFVNALRFAIERYRSPHVLRLLYFAARFINHHKVLDLPPDRRYHDGEAAGDVDACRAGIEAGVGSRDAQGALDALGAFLRAGGDTDSLRPFFEDLAIGDVLTRPIFLAHLIKNCTAAFEEHRFLARAGHPEAALPLYAFIRFTASPIQERTVAHRSYEAIRFIEHGKVPYTLT